MCIGIWVNVMVLGKISSLSFRVKILKLSCIDFESLIIINYYEVVGSIRDFIYMFEMFCAFCYLYVLCNAGHCDLFQIPSYILHKTVNPIILLLDPINYVC